MNSEASLVALDWGTTSFRAWLLDPDGDVLDSVRAPDGALTLSAGTKSAAERAARFEKALARHCARWFEQFPGIPVIAAGMVGSSHGWQEVDYLELPTNAAVISSGLTSVPSALGPVHVVPGLKVERPVPDVIRGEEAQVIGVIALNDGRPCTVVVPGTHSKWVSVQDHLITSFSTSMTGEVYSLLMTDSILGRLADSDEIGGPLVDDAARKAFDRGVDLDFMLGKERSLLSLLFTARSRVLAGELRAEDVSDYVSGILIGNEIRHALSDTVAEDPILICASTALAERYRRAIERHGLYAEVLDESVTIAGLWALARVGGLVPARAKALV